MMADAPRVFLSYSHDSDEHADRVLALADALRDRGIDVILDRYHQPRGPEEGWPLWMDRNIRDADFVLMVCTATYLRRVLGEEEPGQGLGVRWEGKLIFNRIAYGDPAGARFIPILLPGSEPAHIPTPVLGYNRYQIASFSRTDRGYDDLYRHLMNKPEVIAPRIGTLGEPVVWNVPYPRNPKFTGREAILKQLETALASGMPAARSQAIAGLGGVGKTQTAVEYAYRHRDQYRAVLWVRADPGWVRPDLGTNLVSGYRELAEVLGLPEKDARDSNEVVAAVRRWLGREPGYLLILDNADDPALVQPYLPPDPKGHVLLTSRAHNFDVLGIHESIELPVLTPDEALEFLQKRTGRKGPLDPAEQEAARTLAGELGYLPLALEQAAAYMKEHEETFAVYLAAYRILWVKLLDEFGPVTGDYLGTFRTAWKRSFDAVARSSLASIELLRLSAFFAPVYLAAYRDLLPVKVLDKMRPITGEYPETVLTAWKRSFDAVARSSLASIELLRLSAFFAPDAMTVRTTWKRSFDAVARSSLASIELLRLSAFFAPDAIPYELILEGVSELGEPLASALTSPPGGEHALNEILTPLAEHSLVRRDRKARTYSVHRLVQAVLLDELADATCRDFAERAIKALNRTFPDGEYANWSRCERLVPHALAVWGWIECFNMSKEPLLVPAAAQLLNQAGYYLYLRARYAEAERLLHRALKIREVALGPDHPDTATSLNNLALLLQAQGKFAEAEPLLRRALALREAADHPDRVFTLNDLAEVLRAQGRFKDAEPLLRRALALREAALDPDHPDRATSLDTATILNNLAGLLRDQGRYGDAEPLLRRALALREQALGPDHPDTATSLNNLGALLLARGRFKKVEQLLLKEAKPLLRRALKIRKAALGPDHPDTAISLNHLGVLLRAQGRFAAAEPLHRRALKIREEALGPEHPDIAQSLNNLAESLRFQSRFAAAEPLYCRALKIREEALGPEHCKTATILHNLAELLRAQGQFAEAEPRYRRALAIFEAKLDPEHPYTVYCREDFAKLPSQSDR
ncbi:MAG: tetratricopeptide repeat protein [Planctomycetaceae bacterium]|nr:tetratricopeptide repeat protein [Planctomycetaceae bacterium]